MAFPTSPVNGQIATVANISYVYNSTVRSWTRLPAANVLLGNLIASGNITITGNIPSTSATTGALVVAGGIGLSNDIRTLGAIVPDIDNTGFVGNTTNTWANGAFTNLTVDSVISVRGAVDLADNDVLRLGSADDWEFFHNGTDNYIDLNVGDLRIRDNSTQRASFSRTTGNLVLDSNTTSTSTTTGALVVAGGVGIAGNVYSGGGYYWANGAPYGGSSTTLAEENYGTIPDSATVTDDWGLVTNAANTTVDYGSIVADIIGTIDGSIIWSNSIPGNRLISTTDVTVANVAATNTVYANTIYANTATNTVNFSVTGQAAFGNSLPSTSAGIWNDQTYSDNGTRYGLYNRTFVNNFTLSADRTTYGLYNQVETQLQNSLAYSHNVYGTYNVVRTNTVSSNSLDGEGLMVGTYNYVYNQSNDTVYKRQEQAIGTYNYVYSLGNTSIIDRAYGSYNYIRTAGTAAVDTPAINTSYGVYSTVNVGANRSIGTHYGVYVTGTLTGNITGPAYGIYVAPSWMTNYFGGNVQVVGSLSKGSGSFKIDHPLPELQDTHHLVHSFVESPKADLIYRGKATLTNGQAQVNIDQAAGMTDGTFVALCRDVQCFTSNETSWDAVKGTVVGNMLIIECQNFDSNATISWLVIGERQDKHMFETNWTDENGKVIVEPLKDNTENVKNTD